MNSLVIPVYKNQTSIDLLLEALTALHAKLGDDLEVVDIDAAHMIYWEQPEAAAAEIRRFLS